MSDTNPYDIIEIKAHPSGAVRVEYVLHLDEYGDEEGNTTFSGEPTDEEIHDYLRSTWRGRYKLKQFPKPPRDYSHLITKDKAWKKDK